MVNRKGYLFNMNGKDKSLEIGALWEVLLLLTNHVVQRCADTKALQSPGT